MSQFVVHVVHVLLPEKKHILFLNSDSVNLIASKSQQPSDEIKDVQDRLNTGLAQTTQVE